MLFEALRDTAAALNSTLDVDEVLDRILSNVGRVVPHDAANVMLVDNDTRIARVVRCTGYAERGLEAWLLALHLPLDTTPSLQQMAVTGQPLVVSDTHRFPGWVDLPEMRWVRSYAGAPIRMKGRTIGFLNFDSAQPRSFSPVHIGRLDAFADQVAIAIDNARLFADAKRRAERMAVLNDIGQALVSTVTLDQLYKLIYHQVGRVLDVDAFYVAVYDASRNTIYYPCNYDEGEYLPAETLPLGQGPTSHVIRTRSPFVVNRSGHPIQHGGVAFGGGGARSSRLSASAMHVPMLLGDRVIGVISAQSYRENAYGSEDLQMLQVIAGQAAISIQNARLFESEREQRLLAESLRDTAQILNRTLNLSDVLDRILENVRRVMPHDSASLMLIEGESHTARVVRHQGYAAHRTEAAVLTRQFAIRQTPSLRFMLETGQPLAISDTQVDARWVDLSKAGWIRSYAGAPIRLKEQVIGFLSLNSAKPGFFTHTHAERLMAFADQVAHAIDNARLFEEISTSRKALQSLSQRLVEVQEIERRNIARELHDEIGQTLTGLKLLLDTANDLPTPDIAARLGEAQAIANDLIDRVRQLSLELRPAMLDDLGLLPALLWLFERYATQTGVSVNFDHCGMERRFYPALETAVFRIAQEALTNVARHARVNQVWVDIRSNDDRLILKVEDRGTGFNTAGASSADYSSGLAGMRERASLLGGQFIIESALGTGTRLTASLPLRSPIWPDEMPP